MEKIIVLLGVVLLFILAVAWSWVVVPLGFLWVINLVTPVAYSALNIFGVGFLLFLLRASFTK